MHRTASTDLFSSLYRFEGPLIYHRAPDVASARNDRDFPLVHSAVALRGFLSRLQCLCIALSAIMPPELKRLELADSIDEEPAAAITQIGQIVGVVREIVAGADFHVIADMPIKADQTSRAFIPSFVNR
jgi:hypothetical protein